MMSKLAKLSQRTALPTTKGMCAITNMTKRNYTWQGIYLGPGPGTMDLADGRTKPEGVPETWTTLDIDTDYGYFDEDTFPPALQGETLEEYCRRVPNIWSPCSKATDTVDVIVRGDIVWAIDLAPSLVGFIENPVIKIPPREENWHVTYVPDYEGVLRDFMMRARPFQIRVTDEEFAKMLPEFERGVKARGIGHHFKARSFHDFWKELTGKDLKEIANVPTWEEEIEIRMKIARERNAKLDAEGKPRPTIFDDDYQGDLPPPDVRKYMN